MALPEGYESSTVEKLDLQVNAHIEGIFVESRDFTFTGVDGEEVQARRHTIRYSLGNTTRLAGIVGNYMLDDALMDAKRGDAVYIKRIADLPPKRRGMSGTKQYEVGIRRVGQTPERPPEGDIPF